MKSTIINKISTLTLRSLLCMTSTASLLSASLPDDISGMGSNGAPLMPITGAMIPAAAVNILENVPFEIKRHILSYLSLRDIHKNVLPVSKAYHAIAETEFRYQLNFLFQYHDPNSAKALELREFIKKSPLGIRLLAKEKDLSIIFHTDILTAQCWTMMPARSPLVDVFAAKESLQQISLLQVMGEEALLGIFFSTEEATDAHRALVQHLCTHFDKTTAVFITKNNLEVAQTSFMASEGCESILLSLKDIYSKNAYVFGDALWNDDASLDAKPHHLIVTRADLENQKKKDRLGALLAANANHTLMLHVDATETKGVLTLATADLLANLRHLVISDTNTSVTTIGNDFLAGATALETFDTVGFTDLQSIGDRFLAGATALETFDTRGLTDLQSIGASFLSCAYALETFDTRGLTALQAIGNGFLFRANALRTFDTGGLTALQSIGDWFLADAHALETFYTRGLTALKTIGDWFLFGASALETFDTGGLTALHTIGNGFLSHAHALETLDTRGLMALKTIGNGFLYDAHALETFDTGGLTALQSIGGHFLSSTHLRQIEGSQALIALLQGKIEAHIRLIERQQ